MKTVFHFTIFFSLFIFFLLIAILIYLMDGIYIKHGILMNIARYFHERVLIYYSAPFFCGFLYPQTSIVGGRIENFSAFTSVNENSGFTFQPLQAKNFKSGFLPDILLLKVSADWNLAVI